MVEISKSVKVLAHAAVGEKYLEYGIAALLMLGLAGLGFALGQGI